MVDLEPKLSDYALIGNSCSAALVSKYGSIDWCCLPEFHSPAIFAALLDRKKGGHFCIKPAGENQPIQKYLDDTNVVETLFTTQTGQVRLVDAFVAVQEKERESYPFPDLEILRIVEGISGVVKMEFEYAPRKFYGKTNAVLENRNKLGIQCSWQENILNLLTTLDPDDLTTERDSAVTAEFNVKAGQTLFFSLSYSNQSPAVLPELKETAWQRMKQTIQYWRTWIHKCNYTGPYQVHVRRSALALKLLSHAPSGSIVAAPTTSLPERIGGNRNWDYRYCWLRDASFTTRALVKLGFEDEVHAYMNWILHATRLTRPQLQVVYSVYGHSKLKEQTLDWLQGFRDSRPVRIGNNADTQFQLDVYGEVLDAINTYSSLVKQFDKNTTNFIIGLGKVICKKWDKPDNGIWEIRSSKIHHTHSKVMAWVGLDRLIKLCDKYNWSHAPLGEFHRNLTLIRKKVEQKGYNSRLKSYTRELEGSDLDASLLTLPLVGYCSYMSPRMMSTVDLIQERLSKGSLVYRYRNISDGLGGDEGSFGICNFWLVENLVRSGKIKRGIEVFETTLHHAGACGLFSEQIDPDSHELIGNFPQGFTHIGLINGAIAISEEVKKNKHGTERF
ncbi:MAG TPA: glycoside hydrolase family 15 protein [Cyclobacteriaceae bacterium]|nr:glycoside hydrolase family 15 protein [Cyclobacteriaceae bacterium]